MEGTHQTVEVAWQDPREWAPRQHGRWAALPTLRADSVIELRRDWRPRHLL